MLMAVVLFTLGLISGVMFLDQAMDWVIQRNHDTSFALKTFAYLVSFVLLVMGLYIFVLTIVSILSIPVCTVLARKTIEIKDQELLKTVTDQGFLTTLRMILVSLQKLVIYFVVAMVLFLISFFPVVAPIALYCSFMLLAFDAIDYSLELKAMSLRERIHYCIRHWIPLSGLAICLMGLAGVPILNILFLPVAVISASVLFTKLKEPL